MIKFSFLTPLYNGERFIARLLDNLLTQDISTDENEIVILDDCSSDKSVQIVEQYIAAHSNIHLNRNECELRVATNVNKLTEFFLGGARRVNQIQLSIIKNLETEHLDLLLFNYCDVNANNS